MLDRGCPAELGEQAWMDVQGPKGWYVQEGLGQDVTVGSRHAQVRLEGRQGLHKICLSTGQVSWAVLSLSNSLHKLNELTDVFWSN